MSQPQQDIKNLGEITIYKNKVVLDIEAPETGKFEFITNHNGMYHYNQFDAVKGEKLTPLVILEEYTHYIFKIYNPDNTLLGVYQMRTLNTVMSDLEERHIQLEFIPNTSKENKEINFEEINKQISSMNMDELKVLTDKIDEESNKVIKEHLKREEKLNIWRAKMLETMFKVKERIFQIREESINQETPTGI